MKHVFLIQVGVMIGFGFISQVLHSPAPSFAWMFVALSIQCFSDWLEFRRDHPEPLADPPYDWRQRRIPILLGLGTAALCGYTDAHMLLNPRTAVLFSMLGLPFYIPWGATGVAAGGVWGFSVFLRTRTQPNDFLIMLGLAMLTISFSYALLILSVHLLTLSAFLDEMFARGPISFSKQTFTAAGPAPQAWLTPLLQFAGCAFAAAVWYIRGKLVLPEQADAKAQ